MKKIVNYLCEPRLRVNSISWTNGNNKILDDVSFSLYPGEVLCLLGDSGFLKLLGMGDRLGSLLGEDGFCKKFFDCKTA